MCDVSEGNNSLPSWLEYDADTQEIFGFAPRNIGGRFSLTVSANDGRFAVSQDISITVEEPPLAVPTQLQNQSLDYNDPLFYDVSQAFIPLGDNIEYYVEIRTETDDYVELSDAHWLSFNNGFFSGTPGLTDVTDSLEVRVSGANAQQDRIFGRFSIEVEGPSARTVGVVERATQEPIRLDARQFFAGLGDSARFGVIVALPDTLSVPSKRPLGGFIGVSDLFDCFVIRYDLIMLVFHQFKDFF